MRRKAREENGTRSCSGSWQSAIIFRLIDVSSFATFLRTFLYEKKELQFLSLSLSLMVYQKYFFRNFPLKHAFYTVVSLHSCVTNITKLRLRFYLDSKN